MKIRYIISICTLFFIFGVVNAQDTTKTDAEKKESDTEDIRFIDLDGDGFNDNAPDHDGDGIPNGLDPDYQALRKQKGQEFIDLDGDGIDDRMFQEKQRIKNHGLGPQQTEKSATGESGAQKKQSRKGKKN